MDASFAQFAISLVRNEGWWRGLHSVGLGFNQVAVGVSQGLRMGMYPTVRDSLIRDGGSVTPAAMATAGLVSGSAGRQRRVAAEDAITPYRRYEP